MCAANSGLLHPSLVSIEHRKYWRSQLSSQRCAKALVGSWTRGGSRHGALALPQRAGEGSDCRTLISYPEWQCSIRGSKMSHKWVKALPVVRQSPLRHMYLTTQVQRRDLCLKSRLHFVIETKGWAAAELYSLINHGRHDTGCSERCHHANPFSCSCLQPWAMS